MMAEIVVGITGASGSVYGLRLCEELLKAGRQVTLLLSHSGVGVIKEETGLELKGTEDEVAQRIRDYFHVMGTQLTHYADDNLFAPVASGSAAPDAMIIAPCSMGTLARIACGNSGTLLERCADVMLKERRPLVLVPRETPLSEIHLENMLKLSRMGVRMLPAMPAFYHRPESVDDLVDFVVGKALDALGVANNLFSRWGSQRDI